MIIVGSLNSNKSELLVKECAKTIANGAKPDEVLFLVLNAHKKQKIINMLEAFGIKNINVQTYVGLCYNSVLKNWEKISTQIQTKSAENLELPSLCGLEVSQNLFMEAVKEIGFKDYNSKINLAHQLLRRHALIVENNLSENEIEQKSAILNEVFAQEAQQAIEKFKRKTIEHKTFDYLRQQSLFLWLYKNTNALEGVKHLFVDDFDEQTPACSDFCEFLRPQLKTYIIGLDPKGSSRYGYLCADLDSTKILKSNKKIIYAQEEKNTPEFLFKNHSKRLEMLKSCIKKTAELVKNGISPEEICIVTPVLDNQLRFVIGNAFETKQIPFQFVSGSDKLVDDALIRSILSFLKLINASDKKLLPNIDDVNNIFSTLLNIPQKYVFEIVNGFKNSGGFIPFKFSDETHQKNYNKFLLAASKLKSKDRLSVQLTTIYDEFVAQRKNSEQQISNFNFLEKQIRDLERVVDFEEKEKIINQLEHSIIAENDIGGIKLNRGCVIIGTPQKIVDLEVSSKFQFLLDAKSEEWFKQDTGTIYNAWVFARSWKKSSFGYEDSINCLKEKNIRLLRKLKLLTKEKVFVLSSDYSPLGLENTHNLADLISNEKAAQTDTISPTTQPSKNFTPREDQKPVLEYKKGKMAMSAVPGAGKTTILQALISKLIADGNPPESIFVLTYMDSAAKTLKERLSKEIQQSCDTENNYSTNSKNSSLPNISTIHGLALRVIKENGNYSKINLAEDFEVCDELVRQKLIRETIGELGLKYDEYEKFEKAISIAKSTLNENFDFTNELNHTKKSKISKELKEFLIFYQRYQNKLAELNLIDYDDMLIFAVKILEENPQIRTHYQKNCKYILEDEAQDSSKIQQRLIELFAGENGNIVRCGDINQAITSTFTNADTQGFSDFIKNNFSVEMNCSQRCCEEIYTLANALIDFSENDAFKEEMQGAFYPIKMQGVAGKNPISENAIEAMIFETEQEETTGIINKIKEIFRLAPSSTIAVLVRNNFQATKYGTILRENGIKAVSRTDCPAQSDLFNTILHLLKFCVSPWDNALVQEVYKTFYNIKEDNLFLLELNMPFILVDSGTLEDEKLISLHWELNWWLEMATLPFEQLALKIGEYYCKDELERSNLYIIAEIIRRIASNSSSKQEICAKLEQVASRPTFAGLKLFTQEDENTLSTTFGGTVQIMTMHKSKGGEFDYVFVPELTQSALPTSIRSIKTGNYTAFYEELKSLSPNYTPKNAIELKKEILHENLRLFYVTITRAKLKLFFTTSKLQKKFGRVKPVEPSKFFESFLNNFVKTV